MVCRWIVGETTNGRAEDKRDVCGKLGDEIVISKFLGFGMCSLFLLTSNGIRLNEKCERSFL